MNVMSATRPKTRHRPRTIVKVWDLPTRLFHWSTLVAVSIGVLTGFFGPEWLLGLHVWSGYGLGGLIVFRLAWAFFGSEYSRLDRLDVSPRAVVGHLRGLMAGRGTHRIGHNPAGSLMILALVGMLVAILVTGLVTLGGQEKQGVLAGVLPYSIGHAAREIHEILTFALLGMVTIHVLAVVADSLWGPVNLVAAMITGHKRLVGQQEPLPRRRARPLATATALTVVGCIAAAGAGAMTMLPPLGVHALAASPVYEAECGDCHYAFHPSLLPAASWATMMAGLDDHFGENAELQESTRDEIAAWLAANASENWDTEAANSFRRLAAEEPMRITATPYWKRRHRNIAGAVFTGKAVGGKLNCIACHRDARTGRFNDQSIDIPEEKK